MPSSAAVLSVEVINTTREPLAVERFEVLDGELSPFTALEVMQAGWQSWSPAGLAMPLEGVSRSEPDPMMGATIPAPAAGGVRLPWVTFLRFPETPDRTLLLGFVSAQSQAGLIVVTPSSNGHRITAISSPEDAMIAPGETLRSESLLVLADLAESVAFERYAEVLTDSMGRPARRPVRAGWCSWYELGAAVSEADVLETLARLDEQRAQLPLEVVQIDDGYQAEIGDWLTANGKFRRGMGALAKEIRARRFRPGLWLAPFLLSARSAVARAHPDWLLRNDAGEPLVAIRHWEADQHVLDVTHPEAAAWLREVIETIVQRWGYEYIKLDFLYAGALRGRRRNGGTGIAAYRRGVKIIREAAGDAFLVGCGAPFLPSVGLVDAMRVGRDVTPSWREDGGRTMTNAVRSTFAHAWMHGRLWINDPDCVLARRHDSTLTETEVQTWLTVVALSGGMVMVGDDLRRLERDRAAMLPRLIPTLGIAAEGLPPFSDGLPATAHLRISNSWAEWDILALFNWSDHEAALTFDPAGLNPAASAEAYHLFDLWTGEHTGPIAGSIALPPTPPHGVRLLAVHAEQGRPQLVGSTVHLLGGTVEVEEESWDGTRLTIRLYAAGKRRGTLAIFIPAAFHVAETSGPAAAERRGTLLLLHVTFTDDAVVGVRFSSGSARHS